jgi:hypothetical protein
MKIWLEGLTDKERYKVLTKKMVKKSDRQRAVQGMYKKRCVQDLTDTKPCTLSLSIINDVYNVWVTIVNYKGYTRKKMCIRSDRQETVQGTVFIGKYMYKVWQTKRQYTVSRGTYV